MNEYKPKLQAAILHICQNCKFFEPTIDKKSKVGTCLLLYSQSLFLSSGKIRTDRCNDYQELIN